MTARPATVHVEHTDATANGKQFKQTLRKLPGGQRASGGFWKASSQAPMAIHMPIMAQNHAVEKTMI